MRTRKRVALGMAAGAMIAAPVAVGGPSPASAQTNHLAPGPVICSNARLLAYNIDLPVPWIAETFGEGHSCASTKLYSVKAHYKNNGNHYYVSSAWLPPGTAPRLAADGVLGGTCHGWRNNTSEAWQYYYVPTQFSVSVGGNGNCDDAGNW
jgi:hypothetical protein